MDLQRPPGSAAEIEALPTFGTPECNAHVRAHGHVFAAETLVYLLREAATESETSLFEFCGRTLIGKWDEDANWSRGHCEGIIMRVAAGYGFHLDEALLGDFRAEVHSEMWRAIHAGREEKPFWEERFGKALKCKCIDVARKLHRNRVKQNERHPLEWESHAVDDEPDPRNLESEVLGAMNADILIRAIRDLPPRQMRAAFLVWVEGRPVEGKDDGSAANVLDVTPRAVRKLLAKARTALESHPALRMLLDEQ